MFRNRLIPCASAGRRYLRLLGTLLLALLCALPESASIQAEQAQKEVTIGVLAPRGNPQALARWAPLVQTLEQQLPGQRFVLQPLGFDEIRLAVRQKHVDFVLANSAIYVELEMNYGVTPVVTLRNPISGTGQFAGVILTRADRLDLRRLEDLHDRRFAAVAPTSFGGWLAGWRELEQHGVDPYRDFSKLIFTGTHDSVVYAVRDGRADAGSVRSGTLEQMAAEGLIDIDQFHIINQQPANGFPLPRSTPLYPEWPLAKMPWVPEQLAVQMAIVLMQLPEQDSDAALLHWTLPLNYQSVHETLQSLRVGPYAYLQEVSWKQVLMQYWHWFLIVLLLLLLSLVLVLYVINTNRRLRQQQQELTTLNTSLEQRVGERTSRIEQLLKREQGLRGIVKTVADVNQIIITSSDAAQMLKAACDRLITHTDYRFAWVAQRQRGQLALVARAYGAPGHQHELVDTTEQGIAARTMRMATTLVQQVDAPDCANIVIALPLRADAYATPFGAICLYSQRDSGVDSEEVGMLEQLAGDLGFAVNAFHQQDETRRLQQERIANYEETILSMVDLIEKRDTYTAGHTRRVATYCEMIARKLELDEGRINHLVRAARLHDIGKIMIPDAILLKPGRLTPIEYELIQQHVSAGYDTLSHVDMYRELAEIMRHHHERIDGSGYPQGLQGDAIPYESRIMAVADAFDAMTTQRIYKPPQSVKAALQELRNLAGRHYDTTVVAAAEAVLAEVRPPTKEQQLPHTPLERQRFVYFFNDPLTGAYNANYLAFILRAEFGQEYRHACVIQLRGFSAFNTATSWRRGDQLLQAMADYLGRVCPHHLLFRVMGDDFVLLGVQPCPLQREQLLTSPPLSGSGIDVELQQCELDEECRQALQGMLRLN